MSSDSSGGSSSDEEEAAQRGGLPAEALNARGIAALSGAVQRADRPSGSLVVVAGRHRHARRRRAGRDGAGDEEGVEDGGEAELVAADDDGAGVQDGAALYAFDAVGLSGGLLYHIKVGGWLA